MSQLSDEELLFLSNLMHMKKENIDGKSPFSNIWTDTSEGKTLGTLINSIDTKKLREEPYSSHKFDGEISGYEWADMIDSIRNNDKLCNMTVQDVNRDKKCALNVCLTDQDGKPYVVFRGTGSGEWDDNFFGAYETDTEQQKMALDYINSLGYDNITVVGHSKGGNKAKYVALLSDKVSRCVSYDGEGFSKEFIDKYNDLIDANKSKITCYALDSDYVNILMYDIYNQKYYVEGNGVESFEQNHSPNSFFHFNEEGYTFEITEQNPSMKKLHGFVNYILDSVPDNEKEGLFNFLANVAQRALGCKGPDYKEYYTTDEMIEYLMQPGNEHYIGLVLAYADKYNEYNSGILQAIVDIIFKTDLGDKSLLIKGGVGIVAYLKYEYGFDTLDEILKFAVMHPILFMNILRIFKIPEDKIEFISNVIKEYAKARFNVPNISLSKLEEYTGSDSDIIRDYSDNTRVMMLNLTNEVKNEKFYDISRWDVWYRVEDWFGLLNLDRYKSDISTYYRKVIDINETTTKQMQKIFEEVDKTTNTYVKEMQESLGELKSITENISSICK